jgi:hypothetical protein
MKFQSGLSVFLSNSNQIISQRKQIWCVTTVFDLFKPKFWTDLRPCRNTSTSSNNIQSTWHLFPALVKKEVLTWSESFMFGYSQESGE